MPKLLSALFTLLLILPVLNNSSVHSSERAFQDQEGQRVMTAPQETGRRRRVRGDVRRKGRHSIRRSFKRAGKSAGRGGARFGKNIARGRPVRAGKELGKGMGGFGKHTGRGVGRTVRRAVKP